MKMDTIVVKIKMPGGLVQSYNPVEKDLKSSLKLGALAVSLREL